MELKPFVLKTMNLEGVPDAFLEDRLRVHDSIVSHVSRNLDDFYFVANLHERF